MNDYSQTFNHFLNRNIYGLEADASEAMKNLKDCLLSIGEKEDTFFDIAANIFHIFTETTLTNKELVFIRHVLNNNNITCDIDFFKNYHEQARKNSESFIKNLVSFIAAHVDTGLRNFLGVLAISTASVKGYLSAFDKIYYSEILDGWEKYY